ncbi:MAG: preprotein translocase subunit YajC [Alphaproteobacteria bacterium]|nr:preprotein translocase subunit YajC [Alphaproteobacteria bacterium]
MLISDAFAQAAGGAGGDSNFLVSLAPLILIFVVFYFLLIRPQQKKMKQHKELIAALRRGDRIVTSGGIVATVSKVIDEQFLQVEIAEGVRVRLLRGMVTEVMSKAEPAEDKDDAAATDDKPKAG